MNLIQDRWIPVRRKSEAEERIAPWEITSRFGDDPFVRLAAPRPDFNGALIQFLIGLLQTTYAPRHVFDWKEKLAAPPSTEALRSAFATVESAFNMDGDGPRFMQDLTLEKGLNTKDREKLTCEIAQLLVETPGGQTLERNADHFVKRELVQQLCLPCAATALFALQTNAPSGGQGHRTSLRGGGPMTTLAVGNSLWQTCWLNVLEESEFIAVTGADPAKSAPETRFPWLAPTRTSEGGRGTTPNDCHPAQVFWGMPRRIRLRSKEASTEACDVCGSEHATVDRYLAKNLGVKYEAWRHPLSPYFVAPDGAPSAVHPQPGGIGYRHWLGLVVTSTQGRGMKVPSSAVSRFLRQADDDMLLWAFGYDMDNMKARSWQDCTMPLLHCPPDAMTAYSARLTNMIQAAEQVSHDLRTQARKAMFGERGEVRGDLSFVTARFWQLTEPAFYGLVPEVRKNLGEQDVTISVMGRWRGVMIEAAGRVFDDVTQSASLEVVDPKRIATAWNDLRKSLHGRKIKELLGLLTPSDAPRARARGRKNVGAEG